MPDDLSPVLRALDARSEPLICFVRDDDAGWDDDALLALLDTMAAAGVAIDLAVIPQATGTALATELCRRADAAPARLGLHQHGYAHANHETTGRRCEFGDNRPPDAQRRDVVRGRALLRDLFGLRLDDIFTPPWNRCAPGTPALLAEAGLAALSRDHTAPPQHHLPELAVDIDWCKHRSGSGVDAGALAHTLLAAVQSRQAGTQPLGLMLHHAQMPAADLRLLARWLPALARHPQLRFMAMRDVLADRVKRLH